MRNQPFLLVFGFYLLNSTIIDASTSSNHEMHVIVIKDQAIACDCGSLDGIGNKMRFSLLQNRRKIGLAKVFDVNYRTCALRIVKIDSNRTLKIGDTLVLNKEVVQDIIKKRDEQFHRFSIHELLNDYNNSFSKGAMYAQGRYDGGDALIEGMATGTLLGPLGLLLWFSPMASNSRIEMPQDFPSVFTEVNRTLFVTGYEEFIAEKRKKCYIKGAVFGTLASMAIVIHLYNAR
jgi:hypothetical protein